MLDRILCFAALLALVVSPAKAVSRSSSTAHDRAQPSHARSEHTRAHSRVEHRHARSRHREHGQLGIGHERALEIQTALVHAGYLRSACGYWDDASQKAMRRYQSDHHWQTKFVPDSRALLALGLGPKYDVVSAASAAADASEPASSPVQP